MAQMSVDLRCGIFWKCSSVDLRGGGALPLEEADDEKKGKEEEEGAAAGEEECAAAVERKWRPAAIFVLEGYCIEVGKLLHWGLLHRQEEGAQEGPRARRARDAATGGFHPHKASVAERVLLSKRKMEEGKEAPGPSTTVPKKKVSMQILDSSMDSYLSLRQ